MDKIKVIIADDSDFVRDGMRIILSVDEEFEVLGCAKNGKEAVELCMKEKADVILMDIQMPEMSGFDLSKIIRKKEKSTGEHTPIIATTAYAMERDKEHALNAGMDHYISKPIDLTKLQEIINQVLE